MPILTLAAQVDKYQDVGTLTDPESLGACEPGTAISLEGIVWNETKGGDLYANDDDDDDNIGIRLPLMAGKLHLTTWTDVNKWRWSSYWRNIFNPRAVVIEYDMKKYRIQSTKFEI